MTTIITVITVKDGRIKYDRMSAQIPPYMDFRKVAVGAYMQIFPNAQQIHCDYERDGVYDILQVRTNADGLQFSDVVASVVMQDAPPPSWERPSVTPTEPMLPTVSTETPKPAKFGAIRNGVEMARWTLAEQDELKRLYNEGYSFDDIAKAIGRSANSCYQHFHQNAGRWGMKPRPRKKK